MVQIHSPDKPQVAPAANELPHVWVCAKSPALIPVMDLWECRRKGFRLAGFTCDNASGC